LNTSNRDLFVDGSIFSDPTNENCSLAVMVNHSRKKDANLEIDYLDPSNDKDGDKRERVFWLKKRRGVTIEAGDFLFWNYAQGCNTDFNLKRSSPAKNRNDPTWDDL